MNLGSMRSVMIGSALLLAGVGAAAAEPPPALEVPITVQLPQLQPLIAPTADPAADRFIEIDFAHRAPPGATKIPRIGAWVTPDGVFHWPFVMRVRNIGDKPFVGKPGKQSVIVTDDDLISGAKGRIVSTNPFDRLEPRAGVGARFEFTAPAADIQKAKFHRVLTLTIKYDELSQAITQGQFGDSDLLNNSFAVEFDGSRKGWVFALHAH